MCTMPKQDFKPTIQFRVFHLNDNKTLLERLLEANNAAAAKQDPRVQVYFPDHQSEGERFYREHVLNNLGTGLAHPEAPRLWATTAVASAGRSNISITDDRTVDERSMDGVPPEGFAEDQRVMTRAVDTTAKLNQRLGVNFFDRRSEEERFYSEHVFNLSGAVPQPVASASAENKEEECLTNGDWVFVNRMR